MSDFTDLRAALADPNLRQDWFNWIPGGGWVYAGDKYDAQSFTHAASPKVIARLLAERDALEAEKYHLHRRLAAAEQERDSLRAQFAREELSEFSAGVSLGTNGKVAR
jgi:hypothetical protein